MLAYARPYTFGLLVLCIVLGASLTARANSVSVTGFGFQGSNSDGLSLNAGIFAAFSDAPDGPDILGLGMVGVPMTLSFSSSALFFAPNPEFTQVTVGNKITDILTGAIIFTTGTFSIPASALMNGTFTTPVNVVGQVMAFQDLGGGTQGPLMASLSFTGTGTATLYLEDNGNGQFVILSATGNFANLNGNLSVVPEPASLLLMGTGLVAFGIIAGRNRGFLRRARQGFHGNTV